MGAPTSVTEAITWAENRWRGQWANHERLGTARTGVSTCSRQAEHFQHERTREV